MLVTKKVKTITIILKLKSPTYFVSNIRHQHRCNQMNLVQVFITIFKNEGKVKRFWVNFFQSYRLSPRNCIRLSHLMLAIFSPVTYPFFEVLHLIKYTKKKLEINKFLESERDLGTSLYEANIIWSIWIIRYDSYPLVLMASF